MNGSSIAKNTTFYTSALALQKVLSFLYFILIARMIGVEDMGKFSFAMSFTTMFAIVLDFGLTQALIRESARDKDNYRRYLSNAIGLKIFSAFLIYGLVVILINVMDYPLITRQLVYVSGIVMVLDSFALTFYGILRGHQILKYESWGVVINQILILGVGFLVLKSGLGLVALISVYLIGSLFNLLFSFVWLRVRAGFWALAKIDWPTTKALLYIALPFAIAGIFIRLYSYMDIVLLSKLATDEAVGYYSVAYKVAFALQFVGVASLASVYPAFSNYYTHNKEMLGRTYAKILYYLMFISLPLAIGVIVIADKFIGPVFGAQYNASVPSLQIMMLAIPIAFLAFPTGAMLNACNRQTTNTIILGVTATFSIVLNLILIPRFSYIGSAIAIPISYSVLFGAGIYMVSRIIDYDKKYVILSFGKILLSCVVMGFIALYLKEYLNVLIVIAISAVIYVGVLYVLGGWTKQELKNAYNLIFKKAGSEIDLQDNKI